MSEKRTFSNIFTPAEYQTGSPYSLGTSDTPLSRKRKAPFVEVTDSRPNPEEALLEKREPSPEEEAYEHITQAERTAIRRKLRDGVLQKRRQRDLRDNQELMQGWSPRLKEGQKPLTTYSAGGAKDGSDLIDKDIPLPAEKKKAPHKEGSTPKRKKRIPSTKVSLEETLLAADSRDRKQASQYRANLTAETEAARREHRAWFEERLKRLQDDEEYQARASNYRRKESDQLARIYTTDLETGEELLRAAEEDFDGVLTGPAITHALDRQSERKSKERNEKEGRIQEAWKASALAEAKRREEEAKHQKEEARRQRMIDRRRAEEERYPQEYSVLDDEAIQHQPRSGKRLSSLKKQDDVTYGKDPSRPANSSFVKKSVRVPLLERVRNISTGEEETYVHSRRILDARRHNGRFPERKTNSLDNAKLIEDDERRGPSVKDLNQPEFSDKPPGFLQRLKRFFSGS